VEELRQIQAFGQAWIPAVEESGKMVGNGSLAHQKQDRRASKTLGLRMVGSVILPTRRPMLRPRFGQIVVGKWWANPSSVMPARKLPCDVSPFAD